MYNKHQQEFTNDEPVDFKGLLIYPVKVKDYFKFMMFHSILCIDKNSISDAKIISMSYLDFLIYLMTESEESKQNCTYCFYELMKLCTRNNDIKIYTGHDENNKSIIQINDIVFNKKDFNELKDIIIYQNMPNYKDEYINPELKEELEEKERLENKNTHSVSIEKQIASIVIGSSLTFEDVLNLTLRKFYIILEMIDKKLNYQIYKTASMSGMVEFKTEIQHYLTESDVSELESEVINMDDLSSKLNKG